jgi:serine/threonine protein kinase
MGTVADKKRRYAECVRFEQRHQQVFELLRGDHPHAGNLVLTEDFFVDGTRYYKVTKRVRGEDTAPHELDPARRVFLLRTLADSLCLLHGHGIVHGDLKPDNVLLYRPPGSDLYTAKLIDFDDAYPAGKPPARDLVGGNPLYGAPEWLRYLRGDPVVPAGKLTQAADMFAFGLLVHTYLFGVLPGHAADHDSPAAAVLAAARLTWDHRLDRSLADLLRALTSADPGARPEITETARILASNTARTAEPSAPAGRSRVRINLTGRRPAPETGSGLRINLTGDRD